MTDQTITAVPASPARQPRVSAKGSLLVTVRNLWPYLWPSDRADLKRRVFGAAALLLIAKIINLGVPFAFGWATDALVSESPPSGGAVKDIANGGALEIEGTLTKATNVVTVRVLRFPQK